MAYEAVFHGAYLIRRDYVDLAFWEGDCPGCKRSISVKEYGEHLMCSWPSCRRWWRLEWVMREPWLKEECK